LVARRLNTDAIQTEIAMTLVRLPVPATDAAAQIVRDELLAAGTDAPVHALGGAVWMRLSAFAYNELEDYARLAELTARVTPLRDAPPPAPGR